MHNISVKKNECKKNEINEAKKKKAFLAITFPPTPFPTKERDSHWRDTVKKCRQAPPLPLRASLQVYFSPFSSLALQYTRMHTHCHSHCCARTHAHAFSGLQFSPGHAHTRKPVGCYLKAVADVPNLDFYCVFLVLLLLTKYFGWTFNSRRTWRTNARNHVTKKIRDHAGCWITKIRISSGKWILLCWTRHYYIRRKYCKVSFYFWRTYCKTSAWCAKLVNCSQLHGNEFNRDGQTFVL